MSFGKRGVSAREPFPLEVRRQSLAEEEARQPRVPESGGEPSIVDLLLFGVAFVAVAAFILVYFKLLPGQSARVDVAAQPAPIVTSDVDPMETIRQRMTAGEDGRTFDFAILAVASSRCFFRVNSERPWRHPSWTNRALDETNGILKFEYEVAGLALSCLMTEDRFRFCKAGERAQISKAVSFYLAKYRRDLAAKQREATAPETAQSKMYKDLAGRMRAMDPAGPDDENAGDAQLLFLAIANVTAAGYFTAADFGGSAAPELAPYIRTSDAKPCG